LTRDDAVPALRADRLGKRYGHVWGLRDCTFAVPAGAAGTTTEDRRRIPELERENRELRWANVPESGECIFRPGTRLHRKRAEAEVQLKVQVPRVMMCCAVLNSRPDP
jgi:hypothetical protein